MIVLFPSLSNNSNHKKDVKEPFNSGLFGGNNNDNEQNPFLCGSLFKKNEIANNFDEKIITNKDFHKPYIVKANNSLDDENIKEEENKEKEKNEEKEMNEENEENKKDNGKDNNISKK